VRKMTTWTLLRDGEPISVLETDEDNKGEVLFQIIPLEHLQYADSGEWDEYGFVYHIGDVVYEVTPYNKYLQIHGGLKWAK